MNLIQKLKNLELSAHKNRSRIRLPINIGDLYLAILRELSHALIWVTLTLIVVGSLTAATIVGNLVVLLLFFRAFTIGDPKDNELHNTLEVIKFYWRKK